MYVIVHSESGQIFGFGLTPKKAMKHFLRGLLSYDGPPHGVAVCRKDMPRGTVTVRTAKHRQRKRRLAGPHPSIS